MIIIVSSNIKINIKKHTLRGSQDDQSNTPSQPKLDGTIRVSSPPCSSSTADHQTMHNNKDSPSMTENDNTEDII